VKVKTSYPASRNMIGNLYDTKRSHDLYKVEPAYAAVSPFHDRLEASSYAHGYGQKGAYGYGPSFNKGREVAYNHGDLVYPDRLYGNAVDGDHDRYFRYSGLGYKNYNDYGYAKNNGYVSNTGYASNNGYAANSGYASNTGDVVYGSGDLSYGHGGYSDLSSGYKGYGYAQELPTVGGVGYVAESKPTGFLYKNARYIGHGSPYVPYTAPYQQKYKNYGYAEDSSYASNNHYGYADHDHSAY
jgi:hypothetical protein